MIKLQITKTFRGNQLTAACVRAIGQANIDNVYHLSREGAQQAPVEFGDLRGSIDPTDYPDKEGAAATRFSTDNPMDVVVGSDLPYAARQHEDLSFNHPMGGKAKYLEDPLNANTDMYFSHEADAVREVLKNGSD